ncbi:MAG: cupin domain-containing protein [Candidatus Abyssobacteria bacterium SURF_5]|uniref:Cupin domain-containing protein n=1 Tax=Abyssobacteria bacterium (strain SURF_5) TaxID=2093360 RepID=A0A3A4P0G4_ABYX5|nr:MAG: cupin domain-containing protein [Candidatus Abyssubacteria bacterium SURF_5]
MFMVKLGGVIRKARMKKGFTLDDVASRCGYSKALISRIENDNVFPSIESLSKIAGVLDFPLYDIFASIPYEEPVVLRKNERQKFHVSEGEFDLEFLVPNPRNVTMLPVFYSGDPMAHSTARMGEHIGQEWAFVLSGKVEVTVGDRKYVLKEGDSLFFNSAVPHKYVNFGTEFACGVCITIPPSY